MQLGAQIDLFSRSRISSRAVMLLVLRPLSTKMLSRMPECMLFWLSLITFNVRYRAFISRQVGSSNGLLQNNQATANGFLSSHRAIESFFRSLSSQILNYPML